MSTHDFPSKYVGLQQTLFQKSIQSDENNKNRRIQAQLDHENQRKKGVDLLDFRLRQVAYKFLSLGDSKEVIFETLRSTAQQLANELRKKIANQFEIMVANANATKQAIHLTRHEEKLISSWSEINPNFLNISNISIKNKNIPETLETCAEQANKSKQKLIDLGNSRQYGSGRLERTPEEVLSDIGDGIAKEILAIYVLMFSWGSETGIMIALITAVIYFFVAAQISTWLEVSIGLAAVIMAVVILGIGGIIGGLGTYTTEQEKERTRKLKKERRAKLQEGYTAYLTFKRSEGLIQNLYEKKVRQLEKQRDNEFEEATKQEQIMMMSINKFIAEIENVDTIYQTAQQRILSEYQQEQQEFKQEYGNIREELNRRIKITTAAWEDHFWQNSAAEIFMKRGMDLPRSIGEIRIGNAIYPDPGRDQPKVKLPMLIDLAICGHIFIVTTQEVEQQATQLLKAIVARSVFTMPTNGAKFIFIDTKAAGTFADYHQLPDKLGNTSYSFFQEIRDQTQRLEQHQKRMYALVGKDDLHTYNLTAKEPEMQRIICISGFPNPNRFGTEAESYLENIIQSGANVGIHVVLKINHDAAGSKSFITEFYARHGVILQPSRITEKWEVHFNGHTIPFIPDSAPDITISNKVIRQISSRFLSKPVDHPIQVFMCYAQEDRSSVQEVYMKLKAENWILPWLNEEVILPGQDWELEIKKAVTKCDVVIAFISDNSVTKEGYVQKELRIALDVAQEKPEGTIFIIPIRLDDCSAPSRLNGLQWVNYFPLERREEAFDRLLRALKIRYETRSSR